MKLIKKFLRSVKSKGGYTLIEIAAVVAITATLGAVVVPIAIDKTSEGKLAAARADTQSIGGAISGFYKDVGYMPGSGCGITTSGPGSSTVFISGNTNSFTIPSRAAVASGFANWPSPVTTTKVTTGVTPASGAADFLDNQLVSDLPAGAVAGAGYLNKNLNWKGPYSESFNKKDPWGNSYLVYIKAMYAPTSGTTKEYGWIISAGPNGQLDTNITDATLKIDDIGYVLFAADTGH